ncbi:MAG: PDZ domain-containing protein [Flavobacteriales bacterium]|nr:PDZ domain-containing protein [Flavobacteriales bacterium]
MIKPLFLLPLAAVFQGSTAPSATAQQQFTERKVRVEIVTTENGETKRVTKEFNASTEEEMQDALKELGVMERINMHGDDEKVIMDIRHYGSGHDNDRSVQRGIPSISPFGGDLSRTAYLGVSTSEVGPERMKSLKLSAKHGLQVEEVIVGSAAARAGLAVGDVITEVDGKKMETPAALSDLIKAHRPGDEVQLTWYHAGRKRSARVALGEREVRSGSFPFSPEGNKAFEWEGRSEGGARHGAPHAFLGVSPGQGDGDGAPIGGVEEGTAADVMGLREGDRITMINGTPIKDFSSLSSTIRSMRPHDPVTITVTRAGEVLILTGELGERSSEHAFGSSSDPDDLERSHEHMSEWKWLAPEDRNELRREMQTLRDDMNELRRELGRDIRVETRITMEAMPLSPAEKELLKSKGAGSLDSELRLNDLQVVPNPGSGFFRIQFDVADKGELLVNVHDATGEKVYEERSSGSSGRYERILDLTDKAPGTYFVVITTNGKSTARKLIKE